MLRTNRLYSIWCGMKKRCYNPKEPCYSHYGGKGVIVCDEWKHNFPEFEKWALSHGYSDTLTIDRIDNNGIYCPDNCRWATHAEQQRNRSCNVRIEHNGETKTIAEWSRTLDISDKLLYSRYKSAIKHKGACTFDDLLHTPHYPKIYTDRYKTRRPRSSTSVRQYTVSGEYVGTFTLACLEEKGFNKRAIHNCCAGRCKTSCGYVWEYAK